MGNLFSNLYHWLHRQDENFVTEVFAFILNRLLECDRAVGIALVSWLCFEEKDQVEVDRHDLKVVLRETVNEGQPDIWITAAGLLVLVEVKKRSPLGKEQLERYRAILQRSGATVQRLVLLTEALVVFGVGRERPDKQVRWHRVAEWLGRHASQDPVAQFLVVQFVEFLQERRMAVQQVGKEYLAGVEAFQRLVTMLEKAIQDCGLTFARSYQKKRFGFYLEQPKHKAFLVYSNYGSPEVLRFKFDEAKHDQDRFLALGEGRLVDGKPMFELNLEGREPDFFTLPAEDQLKVVTTFIKESFEKAKGCITAT